MKINPIKLPGPWQDGYALDLHTISSTFLGTDSFGHDVFESRRSEIGELLYRFKYGRDRTVLASVAETVAEFLRKWNPGIEAIVPTPPSNIGRQVQPVLEIARAVCELSGIPLCDQFVKKTKGTGELKDIFEFEKRAAALKDAFAVES